MDDIEMGPIADDSIHRKLALQSSLNEEKLQTNVGEIVVYIAGDRKNPAILTFHDIGQNANTCFQGFFQFSEMAALAEKFCVYHINAPGQEEEAASLPENFLYPTMDDLASVIDVIIRHFEIKRFIGFGVGAGANIFLRYAVSNSKTVEALILVNATATQTGWVEWGYQKLNINYLLKKGMTNFTVDYLMYHHFGKNWQQAESDLVREYYQYFVHLANPRNLAAYIQCFLNRTDLGIGRDQDNNIDCPVLQIVGAASPHLNDSVDLNSKLSPKASNWMKVSDCSGLVLDEKPDKVTEAVMLFLQGLGYLSSVSHPAWVKRRLSSMDSNTQQQSYKYSHRPSQFEIVPDDSYQPDDPASEA